MLYMPHRQGDKRFDTFLIHCSERSIGAAVNRLPDLAGGGMGLEDLSHCL